MHACTSNNDAILTIIIGDALLIVLRCDRQHVVEYTYCTHIWKETPSLPYISRKSDSLFVLTMLCAWCCVVYAVSMVYVPVVVVHVVVCPLCLCVSLVVCHGVWCVYAVSMVYVPVVVCAWCVVCVCCVHGVRPCGGVCIVCVCVCCVHGVRPCGGVCIVCVCICCVHGVRPCGGVCMVCVCVYAVSMVFCLYMLCYY